MCLLGRRLVGGGGGVGVVLYSGDGRAQSLSNASGLICVPVPAVSHNVGVNVLAVGWCIVRVPTVIRQDSQPPPYLGGSALSKRRFRCLGRVGSGHVQQALLDVILVLVANAVGSVLVVLRRHAYNRADA